MKKSFISKNGSPGRAWLYSGAGNSFVLVDARAHGLANPAAWARRECRKFGVDGLLVMGTSRQAAVRMRIFNPDGSEAAMCGNGSRCAALWAHRDGGVRPSQFKLETKAGLLKARVNGRRVAVRLTDPKKFRGPFDLQTSAAGPRLEAFFVDTGVPHVVVERQDIERFPVNRIGRTVRHHAAFKPRGTNVSFYKRLGPSSIRVRTYERGVEEETQACGTGSAACAVVAARRYGFKSPVKVRATSGERLNIHFKKKGAGFTDVYLEGPVTSKGERRP